MFTECKFFFAKPLARGPFFEIINYDPCFMTTIPECLKLPIIENNIAEGIIIKSVEPLYYPTLVNGSRVIFKNKNKKFEESFKLSPKKKVLYLRSQIPTPEVKNIQEKMIYMVTLNRLNAVISKIGEVNKKDFGRLIRLLVKDILEEYNKEYNDEFISLQKNERGIITKGLSIACKLVVNDYLIKNL
jgi:Rnl2 family RNA ligase